MSGGAAKEKLRRFLNEEVTPDFCNRQLSETRYISQLAANYLELLYGGRYDAEIGQRIWVRTGQPPPNRVGSCASIRYSATPTKIKKPGPIIAIMPSTRWSSP